MKMMWMLLVVVAVATVMGCATTPRTVTEPADATDPRLAVETNLVGGQTEVNWWNAGAQVRVQRKTNQVAELIEDRREGSAWHQQALTAAQQGKVVEAPQAIPLGSRPVVFVNDYTYEGRRIDYWRVGREGEERREVYIAPGRSVVKHLPLGLYAYSLYDDRGRQIKIRKEGLSYRFDVDQFEVHDQPNFEYGDRSYFGIVRIN